jgi:hypothetical protein
MAINLHPKQQRLRFFRNQQLQFSENIEQDPEVTDNENDNLFAN